MVREKRSCENLNRKIYLKELKVFFLIFNLMTAILAFSYLVSAVGAAATTAGSSIPKSSGDANTNTQAGLGIVSQLTGFMQSFNPGAKKQESASPYAIVSSAGATNPYFEKAKADSITTTADSQLVGETKNPPSWVGEDGIEHSGSVPLVATPCNPSDPTAPCNSCNPSNPSSPCSPTTPTTTTPGTTRTPFEPPSDIVKLQQGAGGIISDYFNDFLGNIFQVAAGAGLGAAVGGFAGGKNGILWGAVSGGSGVFTYQLLRKSLGGLKAGLIAIGVAALIFLLTYKKENTKPIEFQCLPWQAPVGGADCEKCNTMAECSEYTCKSLGQACDLVNVGLKNQKCIWKNPMDTNSPTIEMSSVTKGNKFVPDTTIRPPATGVEILVTNGKCIKAFTPLEFVFKTNEPAQCKVDYNLTSYSPDAKTGIYDNMGYYVGGDSSFEYNHTETLSLPGPDAMNRAANLSGVEIKNDGTYTLYIRCEDANGNFNVNPFSVRFCVDKGPDTTPPEIVNVSIPSGSPIQFNRSDIDIEVYVNEPADCRWSHEDRGNYDLMEYNMSCDNNMWDMNNQETYTCRTKLTGINSREDNTFYFRCLDKPGYPKGERNPDSQNYKYDLIGTQLLKTEEMEKWLGPVLAY